MTTDRVSEPSADKTAYTILAAISVCHLLNDMMQSLLPAVYPILKSNYGLDFGQIGLLTFTFQFTASLLQPMIGIYIDRHPKPYSLAIGMGCTLVGLLLLAYGHDYSMLLVAVALIGTGSSVFHPESSRVARMAAGGRHGLAQSVFQVGGNAGSAIGPHRILQCADRFNGDTDAIARLEITRWREAHADTGRRVGGVDIAFSTAC